jgi:hypothetical protein
MTGIAVLSFASGGRTVNLTQAQFEKIVAAAHGPIFYPIMAALFPVLLGAVLQWSKRGIALALAALIGLLGIVLSLIWQDEPPRLGWRAVIVCSGLLVLSVMAARAVPPKRHARSEEATSTAPPPAVHTKHAPTRLRVVVSHSGGLLLGIAVGAGVFLLLSSTSATKARIGAVYHVYGTCAAGAGQTCGLNERRRPTIHSEPRGQLRDGDSVAVVCQTVGEKQTNPNGVSTDIWDKLDTAAYVTDLYVDTPQIGTGIPVCLTQGQNPAGTR